MTRVTLHHGRVTIARRPASRRRPDRRDGEGADEQEATQGAWTCGQARAQQGQEEPVRKLGLEAILVEAGQALPDDRLLLHLVHRPDLLPEAVDRGKPRFEQICPIFRTLTSCSILLLCTSYLVYP